MRVFWDLREEERHAPLYPIGTHWAIALVPCGYFVCTPLRGCWLSESPDSQRFHQLGFHRAAMPMQNPH